MYQAGVPEKLIQERMGHLSTDGVRHYEHTTMGQHAVSLSCKRGLTYQKELSLQYSSRAIPAPCNLPLLWKLLHHRWALVVVTLWSTTLLFLHLCLHFLPYLSQRLNLCSLLCWTWPKLSSRTLQQTYELSTTSRTLTWEPRFLCWFHAHIHTLCVDIQFCLKLFFHTWYSHFSHDIATLHTWYSWVSSFPDM